MFLHLLLDFCTMIFDIGEQRACRFGWMVWVHTELIFAMIHFEVGENLIESANRSHSFDDLVKFLLKLDLVVTVDFDFAPSNGFERSFWSCLDANVAQGPGQLQFHAVFCLRFRLDLCAARDILTLFLRI